MRKKGRKALRRGLKNLQHLYKTPLGTLLPWKIIPYLQKERKRNKYTPDGTHITERGKKKEAPTGERKNE